MWRAAERGVPSDSPSCFRDGSYEAGANRFGKRDRNGATVGLRRHGWRPQDSEDSVRGEGGRRAPAVRRARRLAPAVRAVRELTKSQKAPPVLRIIRGGDVDCASEGWRCYINKNAHLVYIFTN